MKKKKGITFTELLLVVAILGLLVGTATPNLGGYFLKQQTDTNTRQIFRHLQKTRELAVFSGKEMVFCGVNDTMECIRDDIKNFVIFFDANKNRKVDEDEQIEAEFTPDYNGKIHLRGGATAPNYIRYIHDGTSRPAGSVFLCPANSDAKLIRRISTNLAGRPIVARASRNGLVLNANKTPINCESLDN